MRSLEAIERDDHVALLLVEDVTVASRSPSRVLITAPTQQGVETLARHVHDAGCRAQFPFVPMWAGDFPVSREPLKEYCVRLLDAAAAGSVFVSAVEEMPAVVQDALIELLDGLESTRRPSAAVRLISGTTVSLLGRVAAGTFSEQLFYRLNTIHLMASDAPM
jgi:DNA-binding NtrC family response regulator